MDALSIFIIGMILCSEKNETIVKYSMLNENKQMFASRYKLYLPTEEELAKELQHEIELSRPETERPEKILGRPLLVTYLAAQISNSA